MKEIGKIIVATCLIFCQINSAARLLLEEEDNNKKLRDAILANDLSLTKTLLRLPDIDVNYAEEKKSLLVNAVEKGNSEIVKTLLDSKADPNFNLETDSSKSPLVRSVAIGDPEIVKSLLKARAKYTIINPGFGSLLHLTCRIKDVNKRNDSENRLGIINILLGLKLDINTSNVLGQTPLQLAIEFSYPIVVSFLLRRGADYKLTEPISLRNSLHIAACQSNHQAVHNILNFVSTFHPSDLESFIEAKDITGRTPLLLAAAKKSGADKFHTINNLLKFKANYNATDNSAKSCLDLLDLAQPDDGMVLYILLSLGSVIPRKLVKSISENPIFKLELSHEKLINLIATFFKLPSLKPRIAKLAIDVVLSDEKSLISTLSAINISEDPAQKKMGLQLLEKMINMEDGMSTGILRWAILRNNKKIINYLLDYCENKGIYFNLIQNSKPAIKWCYQDESIFISAKRIFDEDKELLKKIRTHFQPQLQKIIDILTNNYFPIDISNIVLSYTFGIDR